MMKGAEINLHKRALFHDDSKFEEPERSAFLAMARDNPLKGITYGTPAYFALLDQYPDAIGHHYKVNDHHPEHYLEGVRSMSAMALIEMLCDWKAATLRMQDGNMLESMRKNRERFGIGEQLFSVLMATARELGLME